MTAGEIVAIAVPSLCLGVVIGLVGFSLARSGDDGYWALQDAEARLLDRQEAMAIIAELHHVLWMLAIDGNQPMALHARYMIVETVRTLAVIARSDEWDGNLDVESAFLDRML